MAEPRSLGEVLGGMKELKALFANMKSLPDHIRAECEAAFDGAPRRLESYPCPHHPQYTIRIEFRGIYPYPQDCPFCATQQKPLTSRFNSPNPADGFEAHAEVMAELDRDKWTVLTHPTLWPRYETFRTNDDLPAWWPREKPTQLELGADPNAKGAPLIVGKDKAPLLPGLEQAYQDLLEVRAGRRSGAYVYGMAGVGKSMAAARMAASAWRSGQNVAVVRESLLADIASKSKSFSDRDHDWAVWCTDELKRLPLLVVDECGRSSSWTGARADWYEEFINWRYDHRLRKGQGDGATLRTVFVSNVPSDVLGDSRGQTVKSRIKGICGPDVFVFGPDLREVRA